MLALQEQELAQEQQLDLYILDTEVSALAVARGALQFCWSSGGKRVEKDPKGHRTWAMEKLETSIRLIISWQCCFKQTRLLFRTGIPYL